MTPEPDDLTRRQVKLEALRRLRDGGRPWETLSKEERRERAELLQGVFRGDGGSVDEFLARKHAETEAEERKESERAEARNISKSRSSEGRGDTTSRSERVDSAEGND